ncbi:MAG: hypothetical protein ACXAC7_22335, partial [Candidatus Hodarchaeales archaeon]
FIYPLSRSFDEGTGIDSENFKDHGFVNWINATSTSEWTVTGSDYLATEYGSGSQHFDDGNENLEVDVTDIVVNWLTGSIEQNGIVVKLGDTEEGGGGTDYYKKAFHGRESKYIDRIPYIEARWDSVIKDNRDNFAYDQNSKLYCYNLVRGELTDLTQPVIVRIQDNIVGVSASYVQELTASRVETGIYSASFYIENTASFSASWTDVWFSGSRVYMSSSFTPLVLTGSNYDPYEEYVINVNNLKRTYSTKEEARLNVNVRKKNYITHVGMLSSASLAVQNEPIEKMYYSIENDNTGEVVVPFGTGSVAFTQLSYNGEGNYFNIWMSSFVPGFVYRIKFLLDINRYNKAIFDDEFLFKVI